MREFRQNTINGEKLTLRIRNLGFPTSRSDPKRLPNPEPSRRGGGGDDQTKPKKEEKYVSQPVIPRQSIQ